MDLCCPSFFRLAADSDGHSYRLDCGKPLNKDGTPHEGMHLAANGREWR